MSYESEERYWTDYLRVALPVIGLLLMLALFWWWAQQFIGDDGDPADISAATQTSIATTLPPTATNTIAVTLEAAVGTPTDEPGGGGNDEETPNGEDDVATEAPACDFAEGDAVVTNDSVNLREDPDATGENVIELLEAGTALQILGDCNTDEDSEGNTFWRVKVTETAATGYVAAEFIDAAEE